MLPDPSLKRVERDAVIVCAVMALAALAILQRTDIALGVLGGGLISAVSYRTIGSGVGALTAAAARAGTRPAPADGTAPEQPEGAVEKAPPSVRISAWTLAKAALRYALLAVLAYVMIARLRLHPVGLLAGASSVVAAVSIEALRLLLKKS